MTIVAHCMYLERADETFICTGQKQGSPLYVQYTMYNKRAGVSIVCTLQGRGDYPTVGVSGPQAVIGY